RACGSRVAARGYRARSVMASVRNALDGPDRPVPAAAHPPENLAGLSPAYFGMVMATGIVSVAAHLLDMPGVAWALFLLNIAAYSVLWALTVLRMARHAQAFFGDMVDHLRGPGFFTTVAGSSVLGAQFLTLAGSYRAGMVLWAVALVLWIGLTYAVF